MKPTMLLPLLLAACVGPTTPTPLPDDTGDTDDTDTPTPAFQDLPVGAWSFVPVDGMRCGDGSPTGIGVHPGTSGEVLFLVAGGGACWDAVSCFGLNAAANLRGGWGDAKLQSETAPLAASPLFDRDDADNPFQTATWVYVPYCTGDLHAGASEQVYVPWEPQNIVHHAGDANMRALLAAVAAQIPTPDRVWAIGLSAGGYGVQLQADRFATAWPDAELAYLADCSPMVRPYGDRWPTIRNAWSMRLPDGCEDCDQGLPQVLAHQAATLSEHRLGLLTYRNDAVITLYFNYPAGYLPGATDRLLDAQYGAPPLAAFVLGGDAHVMLGELDEAETAGGTRLRDWVTAWALGGEGFETAR